MIKRGLFLLNCKVVMSLYQQYTRQPNQQVRLMVQGHIFTQRHETHGCRTYSLLRFGVLG